MEKYIITNKRHYWTMMAVVCFGSMMTNLDATAIIVSLPTSQIEIKNVVPEKLFINDSVIKLMKDKWIIPDDLSTRADSIVM